MNLKYTIVDPICITLLISKTGYSNHSNTHAKVSQRQTKGTELPLGNVAWMPEDHFQASLTLHAENRQVAPINQAKKSLRSN